MKAHQRTTFILVALASLTLALVETTQTFLGHDEYVSGKLLPSILHIVPWWLWLITISPLAILTASRYPLPAPAWRRHALLHVAFGVGFTFLHLAGTAALDATHSEHEFRITFAWLVQHYGTMSLLIYAIIVTICLALNHAAREREARARAAAHELQPHFLANTLNAVMALALRGDNDAVVHALGELGDLSSTLMRSRSAQCISLEEELALINRYIRLQKLRFGSRLQVETSCAPAALGLSIPVMLLQPLIENAIQHAIAPSCNGGKLIIAARRERGVLIIEVRDSGRGNSRTPGPGHQLGLLNTRERLAAVLGSEAWLDVALADDGSVVTLHLPAIPILPNAQLRVS